MEAHVRPLRADAARNRTRVLDAARTAFAEAGLDVGVEEIARRAGVGKGTLYRRFPTKEALVRAIFEDILDEVERLAAEADEEPDAGEAFAQLPRARPRACRPPTRASTTSSRSASAPPRSRTSSASASSRAVARPLERAQEAGAVRDDLVPEDVQIMLRMIGATTRPAPDGTRWTTTGRATSGCCWTRSGRTRRRRSRPSPGALSGDLEARGRARRARRPCARGARRWRRSPGRRRGLLRRGRHLLGRRGGLLGDRGHLGHVALGARRAGADLLDRRGDRRDPRADALDRRVDQQERLARRSTVATPSSVRAAPSATTPTTWRVCACISPIRSRSRPRRAGTPRPACAPPRPRPRTRGPARRRGRPRSRRSAPAGSSARPAR